MYLISVHPNVLKARKHCQRYHAIRMIIARVLKKITRCKKKKDWNQNKHKTT